MQYEKIQEAGIDIVIGNATGIEISDAQAALDMMATVNYEMQCNRMILSKDAFSDSFFDLRTGVAGEILQKFTNYRFLIAIVGDFSVYGSASLHAFIRESNRSGSIFFARTQAEAIDFLTR
ncbi:DUF4180 domain-containing protein [Parasphaerochaeta coccoides]|uniref:DUF4180 domain-containing protein n=1 Tax=Parasphaerochaeta coccoides (strain ATCC BAA-1237 / DSM 17374 / SPN1) TaxID=760011 RepID=F4GHJ0_PARC1|nr:DUF4180 domain-containing protein [Parasphaerochaeta coccoides]AEC02579.1 hypothetical protein Spico_1374 [Parasphaerochaeta coccoides DSM 17374]